MGHNTNSLRTEIDDGIRDGTLTIQARSLQEPIQVKSCEFESNESPNIHTLKLIKPQRAIAPGQYCCLYINERVLGSGTITK